MEDPSDSKVREKHLLHEAQFIEIPQPTNIYSSCSVVHSGVSKLLVASRTQVFCITALETPDGNVRWSNTPLVLPHIPSKSGHS